MPFCEVNIPPSPQKFSIDFASFTDPIRPDQSMVNSISQGLAPAANSNPVPKPYIVIDYSKRPWAPSFVDREAALETSKNMMGPVKSAQPL